MAKGLPLIDKDNLKEINIQISHADELEGLGPGATDPEVIYKAYELNAIILSEDDDFKRIKANKELIIKLKVGYVLYKPPKHGSRYWEKTLGIIKAWENLKKMINEIEKPFILKIDKEGNIHRELYVKINRNIHFLIYKSTTPAIKKSPVSYADQLFHSSILLWFLF